MKSLLHSFLFFLIILFSFTHKADPLPPASEYSTQIYSELPFPSSNLLSFSEEFVEAKMGYQAKQIIKILVGEPPQTLKLKLSTAICGIWILDNRVFKRGLDVKATNSIEDLGMNGKVDYVHGQMVKDQMSFCNVPSNQKIPFVLVDKIDDASKIPNNYDGLLGFGYQCHSASVGNVNLVSMFKGETKVKKDIIAYTVDSDNGKAIFTLGGYPSKLNLKDLQYRTIPLKTDNTNGHWEVDLHSVFFDDGEMINLNATLSIGIGGSAFGVNEDLMERIVGKYFADAIDKRKCVLVKEDVWEVFCDLDYDINSFGKMSLIVGKWNLKLKPSMLFRKVKKNKENKYWFTVVCYKEFQGQFYLSQTLLSGINTVVYDRETNTIEVFQGEIVNKN